ncbi:hypothetical protein [Amycolatopsis tolypomycina]|uniref:hypothetical protein n=1 Tax=Amycolatopsis tolypomycina TaxID=208445 RepID=UPI0033A256DD
MVTTTSAEALGLGGTTGQLTPGLSADPLVTTGDPLSDLANLGQLQLVLGRGQAATAAAK